MPIFEELEREWKERDMVFMWYRFKNSADPNIRKIHRLGDGNPEWLEKMRRGGEKYGLSYRYKEEGRR